ncbi:MAG: NUDIX domain-containing protein [Acidimicrobiia bacterium]|nr:NUDIX domain-containing protein [Acidimicrobiia bacterium]
MISDSGLDFVKSFCLQLANHAPIDDRERESIKTFCELAPTLDAPFDEHSDPTHVTASAIVVGKPGVVLHLHKRLNMWLQPGGHIDSGESIHDAALREAREETGLDLQHFGAEKTSPRFIHLDVHPGPRGHTHLDVRFLLWATNETFAPAAGESQQVKWFSFADALRVSEDGARGAIRVAQQIVEKSL